MNLSACALRPALFSLLIILAPIAAQAGKTVYSPYVEEGEIELELMTDYAIDADEAKDETSSQKVAVGFTPNAWWKTEIGAKLEYEPGEKQNVSEIFFENIFQLTEKNEYWLNAGLYLEYAVADDHPDEIETKLLLSKDVGLWEVTTNIITNREIGSGSEDNWNWELASALDYRYSKLFGFGIEIYNEFGNFSDSVSKQEHYAGPVFKGKWYGLKYDVGYLFGLTSETPDGTLKANIEIEF